MTSRHGNFDSKIKPIASYTALKLLEANGAITDGMYLTYSDGNVLFTVQNSQIVAGQGSFVAGTNLYNVHATYPLPQGPYTVAGSSTVWVSDGVSLTSLGNIGLSSSNTAAQNTAAIKAALNLGGEVKLYGSGVILINKTLIAKSDTKLIGSAGLTIKLDTASDCNILRNASASVVLQAAQFTRASNVVTVTEKGHPRVVGDQVLITNLATDTSFNGLVTITSVTDSTWTYASTGSNGIPTGFGYVAPANNQLAAANFVRASNVVTVTEAGHNRKVGNKVYIANLATDTAFNGTQEITSVSGNTWTYANTGANGSPTGTGIVNGDNDISISGITFDGNTANQSISSYDNSSACFGIIFGNCGNITLRDNTHLNQRKYAVWQYNVSDSNAEYLHFNTISDGLHFEGPADRISVYNLFGNTNDDMVAFTNVNGASGGSYLAFASPCGLGNFGSITVTNLFPNNSNAPALVKITGDASTSVRSMVIDGVKGSLSATGGFGFSIVDDTASLTGMVINELIIKNVNITGGAANAQIASISASGAINKLRFENITWPTGFNGIYGITSSNGVTIDRFEIIGWNNQANLSATQIGIRINATLDELLIDGFEFRSNSAGPFVQVSTGAAITTFTMTNGKLLGSAGSGYSVYQITSSSVTSFNFSNIVGNGVDSLLRQNGATITAPLVNIDNVTLDSITVGLQTISNMVVNANNFKVTNVGNNVFQVAAGTFRVNGKNCQFPAGQAFLFNFGGSSISWSSSDAGFGVDMGNPAATIVGEVPIAGDLHWNTNATTAGLYGRTAAAAWAKIF